MSDSIDYLAQIREAYANARLIEVDYVIWRVYELPPSCFDRRRTASLIFENESVIRRVRDFPNDWRSLPTDKLFALSWTT